MKNFLLAFSAFLFFFSAQAQFTRYIVRFKDKGGTPYTISNPSAYLSQRALDRRTRFGIAIDSTDLPVNPSFVSQVGSVANVTILNVSKWLNAVTIQTSDGNALANINALPFVKSSAAVAAKIVTPRDRKTKLEGNMQAADPNQSKTLQVTGNYFNYSTASFNEIHLHNGEFLHNIGLRGQGMEVGILDNGFNNYTSPLFHAFDSVNANQQVLGTWDFVAREQNVSNDGNHGMSCFSIIAGDIPGQFIGKAPQASFWLFQTEDNSSEFPIEEVNWSCGAERADSSGADVISSSLGYSSFDSSVLNNTYADMNGNTTMAAIAADLAAKKGLLVFIANGNEGNTAWHYLTSPADGDSVIGVGAVDVNGIVGGFSSYGPSSDGQIKPDLASVGVSTILETASGALGFGSGTSFACPNLAGMSTCLWQGFPEFNNMKIRSALWQAGSISSAPDDRIGYGIPDMKKAFGYLLINFSTANGAIGNCKTSLTWTSKDVSAMKYEVERKAFGESNYVKVAQLASAPNTTILATHDYQYADSLLNVQSGTVSYRIRQIIDTAASTFTAVYIDTVDLVLGTSCVTTGINPVTPDANKIRIIPNPAAGQFILSMDFQSAIPQLSIHVIDMKGSSLLKFNRSKNSGAQNFTIPIHSLPRGKYTIAIYEGDHFLVSKELIRL